MPCEYCKPSLEPKKIVRIPDPDPKLPGESRYGYRIYRKGNFPGVGSLAFYSNANGEFAELPARFCPMCRDPLHSEGVRIQEGSSDGKEKTERKDNI